MTRLTRHDPERSRAGAAVSFGKVHYDIMARARSELPGEKRSGPCGGRARRGALSLA